MVPVVFTEDWDLLRLRTEATDILQAIAAGIPGFGAFDGDALVGYLRVLPPDDHYSEVAIGRVLSLRRRQGIATALLQAGIETARSKMGAARIMTEAQVYARGLYEKAGFIQVSEEFLEDGIPHIRMMLEL